MSIELATMFCERFGTKLLFPFFCNVLNAALPSFVLTRWRMQYMVREHAKQVAQILKVVRNFFQLFSQTLWYDSDIEWLFVHNWKVVRCPLPRYCSPKSSWQSPLSQLAVSKHPDVCYLPWNFTILMQCRCGSLIGQAIDQRISIGQGRCLGKHNLILGLGNVWNAFRYFQTWIFS